jgi:hypothetical protein
MRRTTVAGAPVRGGGFLPIEQDSASRFGMTHIPVDLSNGSKRNRSLQDESNQEERTDAGDKNLQILRPEESDCRCPPGGHRPLRRMQNAVASTRGTPAGGHCTVRRDHPELAPPLQRSHAPQRTWRARQSSSRSTPTRTSNSPHVSPCVASRTSPSSLRESSSSSRRDLLITRPWKPGFVPPHPRRLSELRVAHSYRPVWCCPNAQMSQQPAVPRYPHYNQLQLTSPSRGEECADNHPRSGSNEATRRPQCTLRRRS